MSPSAFRCPVNGEECSFRCLVRPWCERDPDAVMALMVRLDEEVTEALSDIAREGSDSKGR